MWLEFSLLVYVAAACNRRLVPSESPSTLLREISIERRPKIVKFGIMKAAIFLNISAENYTNNNNNNNNENIYGVVIVAKAIARVSGSCDEYGTAPSGRRPSDQAKRPGL